LTGSQNLMLMEATVLSDIGKTLTHRGIDPQVYFWRTMAGTEVDIVVETGGKLVPIEIKLSVTPLPAMASAVKVFRKGLGDKALPG
jgi:predicted AAA+ superfamily ATPase